MNKSISSIFVFGLLLTMLVPFAMMDAYAATPGDLYASTKRASTTPGAIFIVSQSGPFVETFIGDPTAGTEGLVGIAFDSTGKLFGVTVDGATPPSHLLQINPDTGGVILDFGIIGHIDFFCITLICVNRFYGTYLNNICQGSLSILSC